MSQISVQEENVCRKFTAIKEYIICERIIHIDNLTTTRYKETQL